jgi:hypothetical protein
MRPIEQKITYGKILIIWFSKKQNNAEELAKYQNTGSKIALIYYTGAGLSTAILRGYNRNVW